MADSQEQPAKNWQISALEKRLDQAEKHNQRIEDKLDKILGTMISNQQYEMRLSMVEKNFEEKLKSEIREVNLKYGPLARTITWLTRALIVAGLGVITQLIIFLLYYFGRT